MYMTGSIQKVITGFQQPQLRLIEGQARHLALRAQAKGDVFVITGPLFEGATERIGQNQVLVPTGFFKMAHDPSAGKCWMHAHQHNPTEAVRPPSFCGEFAR